MNEGRMDAAAEELFARLVAGELVAASPEVEAEMKRDPEFRRAVEAAGHLRAALERTGAARQQAIAQALEDVSERDRERAARFLRGQVPARAPRRRLWVWPVLVAAAALALVVFVPREPEPAPGATGPLTRPVGEAAFPVGDVPGVDHFQLPESLPLGGSARFLVYDNAAPERVLLLESPRLESERWDLTEQEIEALPASILWIYELWDGTGQRLPSGSFEARIGQ